MKKNLLYIVTAVALLFLSSESGFAKVNPTLGNTAKFVLFTSTGAVSNVGPSYLDGYIGSNGGGGTTNFGITLGTHEIHDGDIESQQAAADLVLLYNQLNGATGTVISTILGAGNTLLQGVYQTGAASNLTGQLILNGQGDPRAEFIFKIGGAFSTAALSEVVLINGADPCNIYWVVEGEVGMAAGTIMKGTVIANNAAISLGDGVNLEGRALSTTGAIATLATTAYIPDCSYILTPVINRQTSSIAVFTPNPMKGSVVITLPYASASNNSQLKIFNMLGKVVINKTISNAITTVETNIPAGIYFYKLTGKDNKIQTGKLISK